MTRNLAVRLQQVIEQAMESPLTDEQRASFEENLINEWQLGEESRAGIKSAVEQFNLVKAQIDQMPRAKQSHAWREFGRQLYMYAEREGRGNVVGEMILKAYEARHTLLVSGNPPLSRQAAESYAEMNAFFHSVIARAQVTLSAQQKQEIIDELVGQFPGLPQATKDEISKADSLWGVIRYNWKEANRDERERFRQDLLRLQREQAKPGDQPTAPAGAETPEAEPAAQADKQADKDEAPAPAALAKNSRFIEAVKKLRLGMSKGPLLGLRK